MGRVINVNWEEVHKIGKEFLNQSMEISDISSDLRDDYISVRNAWRGEDANNYLKKSNIIVNKLKRESKYLNVWYEFLTDSSKIYNGNIESGLQGIRAIESTLREEEK